MSARRNVSSVAIVSLIAGLALWCSRASLGLINGPSHPIRVAMLPPVVELGGLACLGVVIGLGSASLLRRRAATRRGPRDASQATAIVLPLAAASLLVLPYLPVLPDWLPVLNVLAGPGKWLLWGLLAAEVVWSAVARLRSPRADGARAGAFAVVATFVAGLLLFGGAAWRLSRSPIYPGGDEPHYLILAQSLWRDHDFKIENNHRLAQYREYYTAGTLEPHYLGRGRDGEIYSVHPVGLPILIAPVFALAGYRGVVWFLAAVAAAAAALTWASARTLTGSRAAATFAWAALVGSASYLLNSIAVYPEILAALAVMTALAVSDGPTRPRGWLLGGVAIAALPWLSTKYAPMAATLALVAAWRLWRRDRSLPSAVAALGPVALSLAGWFAFFYAFWGSPSPAAPYAGYDQTRLLHLRVGAPGLLFDQEYGIVPYAPVFVLVFTGLVSMWRSGGDARIRAIEMAAVAGALVGTVGAFRIWWGGDAAPGRPVASVLPLLALPVAWQFARTGDKPCRRAAYLVLMLAGATVTAAMVFAQNGLLVNNGRDGVSELLQWLSPDWHLWALAPSYIYHGPVVATGCVLVWLAVAAAAAVALDRVAGHFRIGAPTTTPPTGRHYLAATFTVAAAILVVATVVPMVFGGRLQPPVVLGARARVALVDDFDATRRPLAIVYDPLRKVDPQSLPSLFVLEAEEGLRRARQPVRLLFNARFALPAGEYLVELSPRPDTPLAGTLALQVGRIGAPIETWPLTGGTWQARFAVPLDANFVGFRASSEAERVVRQLRLIPRRIVDAHGRPQAPPVLAASAYGASAVYFHDEQAWPERAGFWTRGGASVPVTVVLSPRRTLVLKLHSGARNHIGLETPTWRTQIDLAPGVDREVVVPATRRPGVIPLRITAAAGFTPAAGDARSTDERFLGCWVEVNTRTADDE